MTTVLCCLNEVQADTMRRTPEMLENNLFLFSPPTYELHNTLPPPLPVLLIAVLRTTGLVLSKLWNAIEISCLEQAFENIGSSLTRQREPEQGGKRFLSRMSSWGNLKQPTESGWPTLAEQSQAPCQCAAAISVQKPSCK